MTFKYQDLEINYIDNELKSNNTLVFLHGWGQNIGMMKPIAKPFYDTHRVLIIDLPGHGDSSLPSKSYELDEFVLIINKLLGKLKIKNPTFIGHSFGGKISLLYASKHEINKLVLLASPFRKSTKKPCLPIRIFQKLKFLPGMKQLGEVLKSKIGSDDYKRSTPVMREILVKHVNNDLTEDAKKIKCPTLIVWGTKDEAAPVSDAYALNELIKDSGIVIYDNATHYAYLEHLKNIIEVLKKFV